MKNGQCSNTMEKAIWIIGNLEHLAEEQKELIDKTNAIAEELEELAKSIKTKKKYGMTYFSEMSRADELYKEFEELQEVHNSLKAKEAALMVAASFVNGEINNA